MRQRSALPALALVASAVASSSPPQPAADDPPIIVRRQRRRSAITATVGSDAQANACVADDQLDANVNDPVARSTTPAPPARRVGERDVGGRHGRRWPRPGGTAARPAAPRRRPSRRRAPRGSPRRRRRAADLARSDADEQHALTKRFRVARHAPRRSRAARARRDRLRRPRPRESEHDQGTYRLHEQQGPGAPGAGDGEDARQAAVPDDLRPHPEGAGGRAAVGAPAETPIAHHTAGRPTVTQEAAPRRRAAFRYPQNRNPADGDSGLCAARVGPACGSSR